mgnify:CR=1 FL=1
MTFGGLHASRLRLYLKYHSHDEHVQEVRRPAKELFHGVLGDELSLLLSGVRVLGLEHRHLLLDFLLNFGRADDVDLALVDELRQLECALRLDVVVRLGVNG